ncbi:MAG: SIMPL domain-containing protein [Patescibacteria group bacterium]|nr:SIMPL domain-containing protein [Patescibacteria group bacterium]
MEQNRFDLSNRLYFLVLAVGILLLILLGVSAYSIQKAASGNAPREISFDGEGKVYAKPDLAILQLGVTSEATTSEEVVTANNNKMNGITAAIKALGVVDTDIETTNYNLSPKYNYTDNRGSFIDGYTLNQDVQVKIRDFDKISAVIQKATSLGANTINQLQFTIDNPEKLKAQAADIAIGKAKEKAASIASASGLKLGKIVNVYESGGLVSPTPMYGAADKATGMGGGSIPAPDIQTGQQEITVTMSLTYQVN